MISPKDEAQATTELAVAVARLLNNASIIFQESPGSAAMRIARHLKAVATEKKA